MHCQQIPGRTYVMADCWWGATSAFMAILVPGVLLDAGSARRARTQFQKQGKPQGVACAASTLEAEIVTPPAAAGLPSSKVFSNEDYKNFLKGYKSQVEEHDYWISDDMVQGTHCRLLHVTTSWLGVRRHMRPPRRGASHRSTAGAGEIPKELSGTLLRNGPGLFEIGGRPISQPLDGDGMVPAALQTFHAMEHGT